MCGYVSVFVRVLYGTYVNLQRDVSHLVSMIMQVVFDKETWMKFQSGRERLANKATCWPRTSDPCRISPVSVHT